MNSPQPQRTLSLRAFSWITIVGVLTGCTVEPTSSIQDRSGAGTHTVIDSQWYNACHGYCAQMYDEPEGCDEDRVAIEATACHMYCDLGPDALSDACRAALITVYDCIIDQQLPYQCTTPETSPQSVDLTCDPEWDATSSC